MAFQILVVATCRLVKRRTGSTPGRLFQISIRRDPGHFSANAPNCCRVLNVSPLFSPACWVESRRLILFSALILNTVIELLCELSRIMTVMARVGDRSKSFVQNRKRRFERPANVPIKQVGWL